MSGSVGGRFVQPLQQIMSPEGVPMVGAQAFFYATGTSTPQNTYADAALTILNPQPVLTNSAGFWPNIFLLQAPAYRCRVEDPTGTAVYDVDPLSPVPTTPGFVPIGAIMPFAGPTPPTGWLFADGSAVNRTVYSALFAVIGTVYGAGDGSTTFNVPDLRGRVAVGADGQGGVAAGRITAGNSGVDGVTLGASGGSELIQNHNHGIFDPGHGHTDGGHWHGTTPSAISEPTSGADEYLPGGGLATTFPKIGPGGDGNTNSGLADILSAMTGVTVSSHGSGGSENVQPSLITLYIIFFG